jgi:hypothetical protein
MGKRDKKRKFSDIWATQTQLGNMFNLSAKEIGHKLNELELRTYSVEQHKYIPTQTAINNGFCTSTPLKHGVPFYMWHRKKVSLSLQENFHLVPLSDADIEYRETALYLIETEKEADEGYDKMYYLFFDTISPEDLPPIIAWALIEARKNADLVYQRLIDGIAAEDFAIVNSELERLGSSICLGSKAVSSIEEQADDLRDIHKKTSSIGNTIY